MRVYNNYVFTKDELKVFISENLLKVLISRPKKLKFNYDVCSLIIILGNSKWTFKKTKPILYK